VSAVQKKNLIVCADDFALSPAVSQGILELLALDRLSATSVMTLFPEWKILSGELKAFDNKKDIGVHLTLTDFKPLTQMLGATHQEHMLPIGSLIKRSYLRMLPLAAIKQELRAQIDEFYLALGRYPDFLDGHQHIHILPGIRDVVFELYKEIQNENPNIYLRNCYSPITTVLKQNIARVKTAFISFLGHQQYLLLKQNGVLSNHGFAGIYDLLSDCVEYGNVFQQFVQYAGHNHLMMCHPGYVDDVLKKRDPVTAQREKELQFLKSNACQEMLAAQNFVISRLAHQQ